MVQNNQSHDLANHTTFSRTFQPGELTIGFISPACGYPDSPFPSLADQAEIVQRLDQSDAAALWLRDVPFYDPSFGDTGQVLDPLVYAGWLAALTGRIAIGTAGIVSPLREPIITAKQLATADQLLGGRFLAGMASGDRATEYPAFGVDFSSRVQRYQEAVALIKTLTSESFPRLKTEHFGELRGDIDLVPKPAAPRIPVIAIGRAGQSLEWLAENVDAWIWHGDPLRMPEAVPHWREVTSSRGFVPFGYGAMFDLDTNADAPLQTGRVLRGGRHALKDFFARQREAGINHVALNLKPTRRPALEVIDELQQHILPAFTIAPAR
ncbi:LLM class oxidoreductase [Pseudomonas baltica]|uniref:LLM class oxidoreductase n=1 Tax=Pseudomonas baltica TaxID=2762576 RepID=UPI0028A08766|nr:LLM class oxidoreductase [Pseudomonas baltica]